MPARSELADQRPELGADLRVEADGRLVEQDQLRVVDEAAGEQQAAAHAAGELVDRVAAAVAQAGEVERAVDRGADVGDPVEARVDGEVVLDGDVDVEVVELGDDAHLGAGGLRRRPGSSCPSTRSSPASAIAWPVSSRIVVDLPAPLGPSRPRQMPSGTSRSSPSTAVIGPKRLTTPRELDRRHLLMLLTRSPCRGRLPPMLDERWIRALHVEAMRERGPARRARAARPLPGLDDRRPARRRLRRRPQLRRAGRARRPRPRHAERARRRDDRPRRQLLPGRRRGRGRTRSRPRRGRRSRS